MTSVPPRPRMTSRYYAPGEVIAGKYELMSLIGEGGMGSVWLARNQSIDSRVALKLLRADLDADDAAERLLQEARAAARIGHRAIVRVFDVGHTEQGDPFLVMELLEGDSLATVLASRGRLTPITAVQTLLPIIDAVAAAHARGIVHRDLKPDNIFLVREQRRTQPKVLDFGIAKVNEQVGPARTVTRQGTVLGSPGYMSPEQARGLPGIDQRTDVWSICVVLYECITGRAAFEGDNYNALMCAIIEATVVPSVQFAAGDAALWAILERGLSKSPEERWASMGALGTALVEWLSSHGIDQDVCGDGISTLFDETVPSGPRDILSVPPPSMLTPSRNTPFDARTANHGAAKIPSVPAGPESTSAIVSSALPPRPRGVSMALVGGVLALGILVTLLLGGRGGSAQRAAGAGSALAPALSAAKPPVPASVAPAPEAPAVVVAPVAPSAPKLDQTSALPLSKTAPVAKKTGKVGAVPAKPVVPGSNQAPHPGSDLKDPY